jgi:hypothetical protein
MGSAPEEAEAAVRMSRQDFLRLIVQDLDFDSALADGRVQVTGDVTAVRRLLAMARGGA